MSAGCTRRLGGQFPAALVSDESALEACIRDDALYKLTIFTFYLFNDLLQGRNKFCITVGSVTGTAGMLIQSVKGVGC